jgi:hypothetical protein
MRKLGKMWKGNEFCGNYVEVMLDEQANELVIGCLSPDRKPILQERVSTKYPWAQEMISGVPSRNFIPD